MVVLNKIYTRTGDRGKTALGNGLRVDKNSIRVSAYGTVDELNSIIGLARLRANPALNEQLAVIQNDLFDLGADLCVPISEGESGAEHPPLRMTDAQTERLEREIDEVTSRLTPLRSFILPGGTESATLLHQCRTVARRAERFIVELTQTEEVNPAALQYLNRLSDWFFVAARDANDGGKADILWVPGANR